jgi:GNAT superfamily N-acetyltransferase
VTWRRWNLGISTPFNLWQDTFRILNIGSMTSADLTVSRPRAGEWHVSDGDLDVGVAYAMRRPNQRWYLSLDSWRDDAYQPLLTAISSDIQQDLLIAVNDSDFGQLDRLRPLGFTVSRREDEYRVPTDPIITGLGQITFPSGLRAISAAEADVDALRLLDDLLRRDIPGAEGWVNDPVEFAEYTFDPRHFDPATYLVAVDTTGTYAGLARVWNDPGVRMLGLIAVIRACRRQGVARALLAAAFRPLHDQGVSEVAAEVDVTNDASATLLRSLGARRVGGSVEMVRRAR